MGVRVECAKPFLRLIIGHSCTKIAEIPPFATYYSG
jgi:hypothetical protein